MVATARGLLLDDDRRVRLARRRVEGDGAVAHGHGGRLRRRGDDEEGEHRQEAEARGAGHVAKLAEREGPPELFLCPVPKGVRPLTRPAVARRPPRPAASRPVHSRCPYLAEEDTATRTAVRRFPMDQNGGGRAGGDAGAAPLRVAIIGAGPSGFYAAAQLLAVAEPEFAVDLFDRLPTPFLGLRAGVAPDHPSSGGLPLHGPPSALSLLRSRRAGDRRQPGGPARALPRGPLRGRDLDRQAPRDPGSFGPRPSVRQQCTHFLVTGCVKILKPSANTPKRFRCEQANYLIHFIHELFARLLAVPPRIEQ